MTITAAPALTGLGDVCSGRHCPPCSWFERSEGQWGCDYNWLVIGAIAVIGLLAVSRILK
jgi:hypothetical protein